MSDDEDLAFTKNLYGSSSDSEDSNSELVIKYDEYKRLIPCNSNQPELLKLALVKRFRIFS